MYISVKTENDIIKLLNILYFDKNLYDLYTPQVKNLINSLFDDMAKQKESREKTNAKIASYIAERRKTDKNYCRPKKKEG